MKKTIKSDNERNIIKQFYINDNTLVQIEFDKETELVIISLRYVEDPISGIKETILTKMQMDEYIESFEQLVRVNEDKNSIAVLKKFGKEYRLERLYDVENHQYIPEDYKDIVFKEKFKSFSLNKELILIKK